MNVQGTSGSSSTTNNSNSTISAGNDLQNQFMTLLMAELKSQDPTSPMDATAMVGQMVSINQLSQLISINQTLSGALGAASAAQSTNGTTVGGQ